MRSNIRSPGMARRSLYVVERSFQPLVVGWLKRPETSTFPSPPVDKSTSVHFRSPYLLYLTLVQSNTYVSKQSLSLLVASSFNDQRLANFALLHCDKSTSAHWCSLCFLYLIAKRSSLYVAERSFQLSVLRVHLADLVLEFGVTDVVVVAHFFVDDAVWCYFNESVGDGVNELMVMGCEKD